MAVAGTIARPRTRVRTASSTRTPSSPAAEPQPVAAAPRRRVGIRWIAAAALSVAAALMLFAVGNAVAVGSLLGELRSLEQERDAVRIENNGYRAALLRMQGMDRIAPTAAQLGLTVPATPPRTLGAAGAARQSAPADSIHQ